MKPAVKRPRARWLPLRAAFSLIELLVGVAITAAVITASVMIYQNLAASGGSRSSYGTVAVGASLPVFYGGTATSLDAYFAPSYGRAAAAEIVRDQFIEDLQSANAVFCLGRAGANAIHPTTVAVSSSFRGDSLDSPEAFRALLASAVPASASVFTAYRGASAATNASIFILMPSDSATALSVLSVYDIDLTPTTSPAGTYASVKRYQSGTLTDYYDVFYAASGGTVAFRPLVVCFERSVRRSLVEGDAIDRLKQAAQQPFYFVWWPDPAAPTLEAFSTPAYAADDPRASYAAMGGRTAFFFTVPMFPSL
ncbi:MAG: hypothetical protein ACREKL_04040 [Chthoniobacterales bacterium]